MPVSFNDAAVSNDLGSGIEMLNAGNQVAAINSGQVQVLDVTFDEVRVTGAVVPYSYTQTPNVPVTVHPGGIAVFRPLQGGGVSLMIPQSSRLIQFT
ncbi:MAG TPA: hypothetical protein VFZ91_12995 [Allosphingosinicella sp.]